MMSDSSSLDMATLRQYLLGRMPERESHAIEEQYFADQQTFERLEELDDALTHEYVGGALTAAERTDFERTLASMPRRQERLALIRQLQRRAAQRHQSGWSRAGQSLAALIGTRPARSRRWAFAFGTVCALFVVVTGWLGREVVRLRSDVRSATLARETAQRESSAVREAFAAERTARTSTAPASDPSPTSTPSPRESILAVTLTPGLLRDGPVPRLSLTDGALLVRFTLILPPTNASRYQVALRTLSGEEQWRQTGLVPARDGSRLQLVVDLPATVLEPGQLTLIVTPVGAPSAPGEQYHFTAVR